MTQDSQPVCHLCGADGGRFAFQGPLEKFTRAMRRTAGVDYYWCPRCSVLYQHPIFSSEEYEEFYDGVQRSDDTGFTTGAVPKKHLDKKQRDTRFKWGQFQLLDLETLVPGKRVFEIGAGEGTLLASFRERGYEARGIEPLATYAQYARDALKLDIMDGYFDGQTAERERADLVILDNVLEHLTTPLAFLRLAHQMLAPRGILYVAVPNSETASPDNAHIAHITLWSRRALAQALVCAGFRPLAIIQGRPAGRPHEWVCISQASGSAVEFEQAPAPVYPEIPFESIVARWQERLARHDRAAARRRRFGPAYPFVARTARAARNLVRRFV